MGRESPPVVLSAASPPRGEKGADVCGKFTGFSLLAICHRHICLRCDPRAKGVMTTAVSGALRLAAGKT